MLEKLRRANPHMDIQTTGHPSFAQYAAPLETGALQGMMDVLETIPVPTEGNVYEAAHPPLEAAAGFAALAGGFYGGMPIQAGYCNGHSGALNALEYHRGCEVTLAGTDFVLLLARLPEVRGGRLDSKMVRAYYICKGEAFSLYETTLHFAPCQVTPAGFKAGIVLPRGTNTPAERPQAPAFGQDRLLFARNKWLLAHPESVQAREKGAFAGIEGENIRIAPVPG